MYSVTYHVQPYSVVHNAHHQTCQHRATMVTLQSSIAHYVLILLLLDKWVMYQIKEEEEVV